MIMDKKPDCLNDLNKVRHIEGFPLGTDEDICALSDPPYYTAYPNPHLADFIAEHGTPYNETTDDYKREPFVGNVSEGKGDTIYNAHTYHTKVPYKAIIPFIKHYTQPGDIVFDGFCGTGMTGVAAQILERKAILSDLSVAASFISYNYNTFIDTSTFQTEAKRILAEVDKECGWMYETWHPHSAHPNRQKAKIDYVVWSDVFECPYCSEEIVYLEQEVEAKSTTVKTFSCSGCRAELSNRSPKAQEEIYDTLTGQTVQRIKQVPVSIHYRFGGKKLEKPADEQDKSLVAEIETRTVPYWFPTNSMDPSSDRWPKDAYYLRGVSRVDQFYTKRNLWIFAALWHKVNTSPVTKTVKARLFFWLQSLAVGQTKMNRYFEASYSQVNRYLKGTLYIGPKVSEVSPGYAFSGKINRLSQASLTQNRITNTYISTSSFTSLTVPDCSIDYIFTDPPFGHNIQYSELNFIWEAWLGVITDSGQEAIISEGQEKSLEDYRELMLRSFQEAYRILKPKRWITVVFHNSKASVWNAIQDGLAKAGFIVAQVATLDKQQKTMTQYAYMGSVKNDLVINAYKPDTGFYSQFLKVAGAGMERAFIKQHLGYLPIAANVERTREMLYSKMLAYYIQRGYEISLNSPQFYRLLAAEFVERDGYWFRDEAQAQEYEQRKLDPARRKTAGQGQGVLFVSDERSAIAWLHHFLAAGPQTYSDLYTAYAKALQTNDDQIPELKQLLEETCVQVNGHWKRPDALTAEELETRRRERLLRQFNEYLREATAGQKLKDVRKEAILTGFEEAYRAKRYQDIITVGGRLNQSLIDSSTEIFDFIDIAEAKVE